MEFGWNLFLLVCYIEANWQCSYLDSREICKGFYLSMSTVICKVLVHKAVAGSDLTYFVILSMFWSKEAWKYGFGQGDRELWLCFSRRCGGFLREVSGVVSTLRNYFGF
jgi:hypothetical protein